MSGETWSHLDQHLRLRLANLPAKHFEDFFLHFLNAGVSLTIQRHGRGLTRKVISAITYAGEGKDQKGIDLKVTVEGPEEWCFQCKRHTQWTHSQTLRAIEEAKRYQAHHYFLVVACNPPAEVHDEMRNHPNWSFWNLDKICVEFRLRVLPTNQAKCLFFLDPSEIRGFVPFSTGALVAPEEFFSPFLGPEKLFRHDWKLVGHADEMRALDEFARDAQSKVLLLVSKGGDGKSRLLWEFTRDIQTRMPGAQALFLNPHSRDDPALAFLTDASRQLVVIDDAHRVDQVPLELLSLVRMNSAAKLVLATRPQGVEALVSKLFEAGLHDNYQTLPLKRLTKAEVQALAAEALGPQRVEHAPALAQLTGDCPFLTVLAGDLLRKGTMTWGQWTSHVEFRQSAFRAFEDENLRDVAGEDRTLARGLLRIIAMLAPVPMGTDFVEGAAQCLGSPALAVETQLQRLRAAELIAERNDGWRIVPDLFADFLVYDACFAPDSKMPTFTKQVIAGFPAVGPAALRNLAEAAWVAEANGVGDTALIAPLVESERQRFQAADSFERTAMLLHWQMFSVYLPKETLSLAKLALALTPTPRWRRPFPGDQVREQPESHPALLRELPRMLKPLVEYHSAQRDDALRLLWELGLRCDWPSSGVAHGHPWSVLAEIIKFKGRGISVTLSFLGWLERWLANPENLRNLEGSAPILRTLFEPCFARFVEFTEWEGRSLRWWTKPVHVENTRPVRDQAILLLLRVIENGSWLAALDALSAAELAIQRVHSNEAGRVDNIEQLRLEWLPERKKALPVFEAALSSHHHVAIRFEVRQTLRGTLSREIDPEFAADCRRILASIPDDLRLRVATALLTSRFSEFDDQSGTPSEQLAKAESACQDRLRRTVIELAQVHPAPEPLLLFLIELDEDLRHAGHHPMLGGFLQELAGTNPTLAADLARHILDTGLATSIAREVPMLLHLNSALAESERFRLLSKTARSPIPGAAASVVDYLGWRTLHSSSGPTTEQMHLLRELARNPDATIAASLLGFCTRADGPLLDLVCRLLETIPLSLLPPEVVGAVWGVLVPHRKRLAPLPEPVLVHVLKQLVAVPELDLDRHGDQFHHLLETMPRAICSLLRDRIHYAASPQAPDCYHPLPHGHIFALRLPKMVGEPDYGEICEDLWARVLNPNEPHGDAWRLLWQAVVLNEPAHWLPRLVHEVEAAPSAAELRALAGLLRFDGSLLIFRFPELARTFLAKAQTMGGDELLASLRSGLYAACRAGVRGFTNGVLDRENDYLEAEAAKAAETHASDLVLGPFYRWIIEMEQRDRLWHKARWEAEEAALE